MLLSFLQCHAFRHINERNGSNYCSSTDEIILIDLFVRLLFFSVSNSTLCGEYYGIMSVEDTCVVCV